MSNKIIIYLNIMMNHSKNTQKVFFGNKIVTKQQKSKLVQNVFDSVVSKYDVMNDIMSLTLHRMWKKKLVNKIQLFEKASIIDVAGGTGDIAIAIAKKKQSKQIKNLNIELCDINQEMIQQAKKNIVENGLTPQKDITCYIEDAQNLSKNDKQYDYYTIVYGIRNVVNPEKVLAEANRVLKPGGKFLCLEFSQVQHKLIRKIYDIYSMYFIPKIGELITNDKEAYKYFVESIRKFYTPQEFVQKIKQANFIDVTSQNLAGGITTLYQATKNYSSIL